MMNSLSRRSFLVQGAAVATSAAVTRSAFGAAKRVRLRNSHLPAGASGTLLIGGDLQVNRLGLGTAEFTGPDRWGPPADPAMIRAVIRHAYDLGINLIDTADVYGPYIAEQLVHDALYPYPADLVIATKGGQTHDVQGQPNAFDARPERLRAACEASLKRLQLEQIALYYLHSPDPKVPYEDSIGELAKLQKEGKIRHIGISDVNAEQLATARSLVTVTVVQNAYNILTKRGDEIIGICEREHIVFVPFSTFSRGRMLKSEDDKLAGLQALAKARGIDLPQAVLAWELARSPVTLPIFGTTRIDHLEDDIAAAKVHFTKRELEQLG